MFSFINILCSVVVIALPFQNSHLISRFYVSALHIRYNYCLDMQEFYADFVAVDPYHFTLNMPSNHIYMLPAVVDHSNLQRFCDRVVDGIASIFLALKRRPVIRYQRTSDIAKRIAQETAVCIIMYSI